MLLQEPAAEGCHDGCGARQRQRTASHDEGFHQFLTARHHVAGQRNTESQENEQIGEGRRHHRPDVQNGDLTHTSQSGKGDGRDQRHGDEKCGCRPSQDQCAEHQHATENPQGGSRRASFGRLQRRAATMNGDAGAHHDGGGHTQGWAQYRQCLTDRTAEINQQTKRDDQRKGRDSQDRECLRGTGRCHTRLSGHLLQLAQRGHQEARQRQSEQGRCREQGRAGVLRIRQPVDDQLSGRRTDHRHDQTPPTLREQRAGGESGDRSVAHNPHDDRQNVQGTGDRHGNGFGPGQDNPRSETQRHQQGGNDEDTATRRTQLPAPQRVQPGGMNRQRTEHEQQRREVSDSLADLRQRGAQADHQSDGAAHNQHAAGQFPPPNVFLFHERLEHVGQGTTRRERGGGRRCRVRNSGRPLASWQRARQARPETRRHPTGSPRRSAPVPSPAVAAA